MLNSLKNAIGKLGVKLIKFTARKAKIDLIRLAYWENGILKSHSLDASGESYFTQVYLRQCISTDQPVFLDVGGNKGEYTQLLRKAFPEAVIHTFEPNPATYAALKQNLPNEPHLVNKGVGAENGTLELFYDPADTTSVQATSDPEILKVIAKPENITSTNIDVTTLDAYCNTNNLTKIDLLKIDTEGFELEALIGATELLKKNGIAMIQFEFNEVNIVKRRFIKDFYDLLEDFTFYRLDEKRLIPLGKWKPIHEVFMFQNIVAIKA